MTRKQAFCSAAGTFLLVALSQQALAQADIRIGFVNLPALIQNAPQIEDLSLQLEAEFAEENAEFEAMREELEEKAEQFNRDAEVMSEADRSSLQREITRMDRDLQRRGTELQEEFDIRRNELLSELQVEIVSFVQQYSAAQGFDIVLTDVIYRSEAVDITAEVFAYIQGLAAGEGEGGDASGE